MRALSNVHIKGFSAEETRLIIESLSGLDQRLQSYGEVRPEALPEGLSPAKEWKGTSPEGVNYVIRFWGEGYMNDGRGMWNYYLHLLEKQFTPEQWARVWLEPREVAQWGGGTPIYDAYDSVLESHGDFHGGVTLYHKHCVVDRPNSNWVEVGCDYGHSWDRDYGYHYDVASVQRDALRTCKLLAAELGIKARCDWTGEYFDIAYDMASEVSGGYKGNLSPAGMGLRSRSARERAEEKS